MPKSSEGINRVQSGWTDLVLVCTRCSGRGFGVQQDQSLQRALKQALRERGQRRQIGVVEVDCLGVCPKHAVTVGLASRPDILLVVPRGQSAPAVLLSLGLPSRPTTPDMD